MDELVHLEPGYLLVRAADAVSRAWTAELAHVGLTPRQHGVLASLAARPGISSGALARAVMITPQAMTDVVRSLERKALLEREAPGGRGEPSVLRVSAAGRAALVAARPIVEAQNDPASFGLSEEEAGALAQLLVRVVAAAEAPVARGG